MPSAIADTTALPLRSIVAPCAVDESTALHVVQLAPDRSRLEVVSKLLQQLEHGCAECLNSRFADSEPRCSAPKAKNPPATTQRLEFMARLFRVRVREDCEMPPTVRIPNEVTRKLTTFSSQPEQMASAVIKLSSVFSWVLGLTDNFIECHGKESKLNCLSIVCDRHRRLSRILGGDELRNSLTAEGRQALALLRLAERSLLRSISVIAQTEYLAKRIGPESGAEVGKLYEDALPVVCRLRERAIAEILKVCEMFGLEIKTESAQQPAPKPEENGGQTST